MTALFSPIRNTSFILSDQMADRLRDIPMDDWMSSIKSINIHWVELRFGLMMLLLTVGQDCVCMRAVPAYYKGFTMTCHTAGHAIDPQSLVQGGIITGNLETRLPQNHCPRPKYLVKSCFYHNICEFDILKELM